jgi:hypothetical protein
MLNSGKSPDIQRDLDLKPYFKCTKRERESISAKQELKATGCTALDFDLNYLLTMEIYKQLHISRRWSQ